MSKRVYAFKTYLLSAQEKQLELEMCKKLSEFEFRQWKAERRKQKEADELEQAKQVGYLAVVHVFEFVQTHNYKVKKH